MSRLDSQAPLSMDFRPAACYSKHMDKPPFRELLRRAMERADVSQRELSRRSGKNISTISFTLQGKTWGDKYPPLDDIESYASALEIDPALLRGDDLSLLGEEEAIPEIQRVPLTELLKRVGAWPYRGRPVEDITASAGTTRRRSVIPEGFDYSRTPQGKRAKKKQDLPDPIQNILIEGECMMDLLFPGDIVAVDTRQMPLIGDVVVGVRLDSELLIKFLRDDGKHQFLESKDGTVIPLDQYIRLLGPVVSFQRGMRWLLHQLSLQ